jgi:hypothetical protein
VNLKDALSKLQSSFSNQSVDGRDLSMVLVCFAHRCKLYHEGSLSLCHVIHQSSYSIVPWPKIFLIEIS